MEKLELTQEKAITQKRRYETIKDIGSGNFGAAKLVVDKVTRELFAVKFIEKGLKLLYANGIVNATHLAIVMEYAAGGELFERICRTGRCIEDEWWNETSRTVAAGAGSATPAPAGTSVPPATAGGTSATFPTPTTTTSGNVPVLASSAGSVSAILEMLLCTCHAEASIF
ncbi:hypothetical protein AgCh_037374 [Apium graveolens]